MRQPQVLGPCAPAWAVACGEAPGVPTVFEQAKLWGCGWTSKGRSTVPRQATKCHGKWEPVSCANVARTPTMRHQELAKQTQTPLC
eukprot:5840884-Amphidinium_carterae.1